MKVIYGIGKVKRNLKNPILAVGVFDGLHLGHRYLIERAVGKAKLVEGTSVVMTFFPHPTHVLKPSICLPFLVSLRHRLKLIEELGVDVCLVVSFTEKFSNLKAVQFIEEYIINSIKPKEIFIGRNFRFGHFRQGDVRLLKDFGDIYGFKVNAISPKKSSGDIISSTRIRKLIVAGKITLARRLLGRPVSIFGQVKKGDGRGKILGFPTANINPLRQVIPPCGVYMAEVVIDDKTYRGMANIGRRPSFHKGKAAINVEVHIFKFKKNIYRKEIEIKFLKKIRPEKEFASKENLVRQLKTDEEKIKSLFKYFS